jgi:hypothetical protein
LDQERISAPGHASFKAYQSALAASSARARS